MAVVQWHPHAFKQFVELDRAVQTRIQRVLNSLEVMDDVRSRLIPYRAELAGYWKLRVGDYRLITSLREQDGQTILVIYLAHRREVYGSRAVAATKRRQTD
ncbi:type II toxin-antitoxin system RelE/ParE family toxin [Tianweitania sp. BSSL-BM11]|uniref:Type II toxin-antitoxin system RelE/ParE family toxin n=1 Tax=Tianweitania aestuarii TaxID=2814886 RepID=A0ABS5RVD2_9HYPH|nr:type II toxin-antitoxin system RelE/ParE family toxin [Tianweitania aestuarii]MBS9720937.1 type II toxin-antitoxin system RelE/ParE family toxin [Tianweitania aestuarii]